MRVIDTETRVPLAVAEEVATRFVALIEASCERIEVAGSIRRRKSLVKDIEVLAMPKLQRVTDLFDRALPPIDLLHERCESLVALGIVEKRPYAPAWGPKHKRMRYEGLNVDLFIICPDSGQQWGLLLAIRTGPREFSKALVTRKRQGGLLPDDCLVDQGAIWRVTGTRRAIVETPEESGLFRFLGIDWIEPERRSWPLEVRRDGV